MATNSKHRKDHKKKLAARKNRLANEKAQAQKYQKEFIMNLIKEEKEKGMFENTPSINGPISDGPIIEGPAI
jgi:hypothetical protein